MTCPILPIVSESRELFKEVQRLRVVGHENDLVCGVGLHKGEKTIQDGKFAGESWLEPLLDRVIVFRVILEGVFESLFPVAAVFVDQVRVVNQFLEGGDGR